MLPLSRAFAILCLALPVLASAGCGGGTNTSGNGPNQARIATATLPATLPEPQILGQAAVQPGGGSAYTVRSGDTLAGIAARFGVSLEDLRAANPNIDAASLTVGQSIRLPQGAAPPAAGAGTPAAPATSAPAPADTPTPPPPPPAPTSTASAAGQTYTVQQGDIPATIASKFGVTVEALLAANPGINPNGLHIGDVLNIPPKPGG